MSRLLLAMCLMGGCAALFAGEGQDEQRLNAAKLMQQGNWKDAFGLFSKLAADAKGDPQKVGEDLAQAGQCLMRLGRYNEFDELREKCIEIHARNWKLLQAAAQTISDDPHYGYIVAGKFHRLNHRGGGQYVMSVERDRARALQLMTQALELIKAEPDKVAAGTFYLRFSEMLQRSGNTDAWRLQYLTDLKTLPDYEEGYGYRGRGRWGHGGEVRGAPVGADGNPVYYTVPKSFEAAQNDGERWRWTLAMAAEMNPQNTSTVRMRFAAFLQQQFDVRSMAGFGRVSATSGDKEESGPYAVSTLGEDETIAKLATGIKRFKLPDEFNFIKMYQGIAAEFKGQNDAKNAIEALAGIFEDRQQYPKAAEYWKRSIAEYPNGSENARHRLSQITGNWGQFEPVMMQSAGKNATIEFRFRNANKVSFTAQEIEVKKLLDDTKAYLKAGPKQIDWQRLDVSNIGYKLVQQNQQQYVGKQVAQWEQALDPRDKHFDRRTTITTPLQKSGAYLLTAQIPDGNASRIIIWLSDTAIVKKQLDKQAMYYVADSVTGQPLNGLEVEFFGYQQRHIKDNNWQVDTKQFVQASDADGQIRPTQEIMPNNMQWIATANTADGRFAYLGFTNVWYGNYYQPEYQQNKAFIITDRPAYRPNQPVKFKVWLGQAKYDHEGKSPFANTRVTLLINNPKGEKILEKDFETDEYGGFDSELTLDKEATLGAYSINVKNWWPGATFRLEEYKKPEFEVKIDAPNEPVMLGEKITAKITSKYYFGAPVTDAKVKYKVMRSSYSANWYPAARWDWFYNGGYWWFGGDYAWYPGFAAWGCKRPYPWWYGARNEQPELVIENEVPIEPDGTVKVEIDTAVAKAVHADTDHKYEITAEVTDQSRRTIVGSGSVMVARSPYRVYAWVDRGHYRVGDVIKADFSAQTLDNKPVQGKGKLKLLKIAYDKDSQPVETQVQEWAIDTDAQGKAQQQMKADQPGQYRISYSVSDAKNHTIEGGYLFVVMGEGFDGSQFRFNNIELVTDKREYKPGEKVQLMINSNRAGGTVLLFTRPSNGVYLPPKVIRLKGKSTIEEIEIHRKDMPNFFLEALTISDGKLFSEVREVIVPPENKVLDVAVVPSANQYKPGEKAKIQLKLTDPSGEPYSGSAVVSVYDKSIEYISGGSNVPEIRSHFWKWRRNHYEQNFHNLSPYSSHLLKPNEIGMQFLGAFGYLTAELDSLAARTAGAKQERRGAGEGEYRYLQLKSDAPGAPPAPTAAAANAMDAGGGAFGLREAGKKEKAAADKDRGAEELEQQNAQSAPDVEPTVRSNFADSAYWAAKIVTAANGIAEIEVPMPENLTTWKIKVWSMGQGTRVGQGEAEIITSKNLIVRLQAPRFVTERDEVVLSANVHNYLKNKKNVRVELEVDSGTLQAGANTKQSVDVDATGEKRVDWRVKVLASGQPKVRVRAITDEESDAMEMTFPSYVHGMVKTESVAGAMRPDKNSASFTVNVPAQRRETDSRLEVRYSPTLAGAMVDALPYLVDYPYGCTEQTLSRFLPTVITQKVLNRMNINLKEVQGKVTNLNAQEIGDDVARSKQWQRHKINPVFDEEEVGAWSAAESIVLSPCSAPTAAGAGSAEWVNAPIRTRRPMSSTVCRPRRSMASLSRRVCWNAASSGSRRTRMLKSSASATRR